MQAGQFVQVIEERQGHPIACLEEIAFKQKFINNQQLKLLAERLGKSGYGQNIRELLDAETICQH